MRISIFKSNEDFPHVYYGNDIRNDEGTFDRFYIYPDGHVDFCERTEYPDEASFDETKTYETLSVEVNKKEIEEMLSDFFGDHEINFYWDIQAEGSVSV